MNLKLNRNKHSNPMRIKFKIWFMMIVDWFGLYIKRCAYITGMRRPHPHGRKKNTTIL